MIYPALLFHQVVEELASGIQVDREKILKEIEKMLLPSRKSNIKIIVRKLLNKHQNNNKISITIKNNFIKTYKKKN